MPKEPEEDTPNMVDSNGAPGAMDEDGNYDPDENPPDEVDNTPIVRKLTAVYNGAHTDIIAVVEGKTPVKRRIVPGTLTAAKLGGILANADNW